jgi:fermentation-respiration switch protein FrsA (DUF1100 family)
MAVLLIHGTVDEVVPVERSRMMYEGLDGAGWNVTLREVDTDHAGVIGSVYEPSKHRCIPSDSSDRQRHLAAIAEWIADFARVV